MRSDVFRAMAIAAALIACVPAWAADAPATLKVGDVLARFDRVVPATRRYVRYVVAGEKRSLVDIWTRRTSIEQVDGAKRLHIRQRWEAVGTPAYTLVQDSWFEAGTFRPLEHLRRLEKDGEVKVSAFRFTPDGVSGDPAVAGNARADYRVTWSEPLYNFEYDIELLQALPLAQGYEVSIPFVDPGIDQPARYTFKVAGSERLEDGTGRAIDCWLVTADYNTDKVVARFWIDKGSQVLVRESVRSADGSTWVKALLMPAGDGDG